MQSFSFRPAQRLLTKSQFSNVFDNVEHRVSRGPILLLATKTDNPPRLGLVVRKKFLKLAVQRNQFKRIARETFRTQCSTFESLDILLMNRSGGELFSNKDWANSFNEVFAVMMSRINKQTR